MLGSPTPHNICGLLLGLSELGEINKMFPQSYFWLQPSAWSLFHDGDPRSAALWPDFFSPLLHGNRYFAECFFPLILWAVDCSDYHFQYTQSHTHKITELNWLFFVMTLKREEITVLLVTLLNG